MNTEACPLAIGNTVGEWTLITEDRDKPYHWICRCSCGREKSVRDSSLKSGRSLSCGHLRAEALARLATSHGMSRSPEYKTWTGMLARVKTEHYVRKGIKVCRRWQTFEHFFADMGTKPDGERISLERLNNAKNYSASNCVWATPLEQNNNKGNNVVIDSREYGQKTLAQWSVFLMEQRGDTTWTAKRLSSVLKSMTIDQVLRGLEIEHRAEAEPFEFVAA